MIATRWTTHLDAVGGSAEALGVGGVALDELAAPGLQRLRATSVAYQRTDVVIASPQRVDDLRADRTRSHR